MKHAIQLILSGLICVLLTSSLHGQDSSDTSASTISQSDFADRQAILKTLENFYIGDKTGSIEHKKLSQFAKGAYRYINRDGEYAESPVDITSDHSDPNYTEELLGIEIYNNMALARLRLEIKGVDGPEYKLMILHKSKEGWKISTICWGFGVTQ